MAGSVVTRSNDSGQRRSKHAEYSGPTFYTKVLCPICESCCRKMYCSRCVAVGDIYSSDFTDESLRFGSFVYVVIL